MTATRRLSSSSIAFTFTFTFVFALAVCAISPAAFADGYSNAAEARTACEKAGKADTPEKLKECCNDMILVDPIAKQNRLVAQCVAGTGASPAAKKAPKSPK